MKGLTLFFLLCAALLLVACGGSGSNSAGGGGGGSSTAGFTGVASCDEYIAKIEKCQNNPNIPEEAKGGLRQALSEQNKEAWKKASSTPEGREMLDKQCKLALESQKAMLDAVCK